MYVFTSTGNVNSGRLKFSLRFCQAPANHGVRIRGAKTITGIHMILLRVSSTTARLLSRLTPAGPRAQKSPVLFCSTTNSWTQNSAYAINCRNPFQDHGHLYEDLKVKGIDLPLMGFYSPFFPEAKRNQAPTTLTDAVSVARFYQNTTARSCAPVASTTLALHPCTQLEDSDNLVPKFRPRDSCMDVRRLCPSANILQKSSRLCPIYRNAWILPGLKNCRT